MEPVTAKGAAASGVTQLPEKRKEKIRLMRGNFPISILFAFPNETWGVWAETD